MPTLCLAIVAGIALILLLLAHGVVQWLAVQRRSHRRSSIPVSVLKPLKGADDDLEANLESFCRQTHTQYEIIFGVADASDAALPIARRVAQNHPQTSIRIVVGQCPSGLNPKVRLLRALVRNARHDALLISDSNVQVDEFYLSATTAELEDPAVGLVSNPIIGHGGGTLGSALESLQLNSYVIFGLALANFIGKHACVVGKSMLLRRRALAQIGGFARFADILAEDYLIGRAISRAGWRVVTCPSAIKTINRTWTLRKLWQRHLRWSQIRRNLGVAGYLLELLLLPHIWIVGVAISAAVNGAPNSMVSSQALLGFCAGAYALVCVSEIAAIARWSRQPASIQVVLFVAVRQFSQLLLWMIAWSKSEVDWRGHKLRIGKGSRLIDPRAQQQSRPSLARQTA